MKDAIIETSYPNDCGVLEGRSESVAQLGRSYVAVNIALGADGLYRIGLSLFYSYGGFVLPIASDDPGYPSLIAARKAGIAALLRRWPKPFPSDPTSAVQELAKLREQIEAKIRQPNLF